MATETMTAPFRFESSKPASLDPLRLFDPAVMATIRTPEPAPVARRTKIWELAGNLHCSIIGTCLSTAELRQLLTKVKLAAPGASDHDLHGQGVLLASRHDGASKLLNKLLDQSHRLALKQFDAAKTEAELRTLWRAAIQRGEIPGAYWAVLSHPVTSNALVREVFGEVHMLSHLVGAANRADIRRLCQLEADKTELDAKIARQQAQLCHAITSRDATIAGLNRSLAKKLAGETPSDEAVAAETRTLTRLVGDLEHRVTAEAKRRDRAETRLQAAESALAEERERRLASERREALLTEELDALETRFAVRSDPESELPTEDYDLAGLSLLYVGGRPTQLAHLRALGERLGVEFLHHDGGIEDRGGLLAGLVSRADLVMFPVDCVSHDAALAVKRLCRQSDKPYLPLRSGGASSFLAALSRSEVMRRRDLAKA
jgi:hypothetical protein